MRTIICIHSLNWIIEGEMNYGKKFLVTTPIFYPNAKPHLGHLFTSILADTTKRIQKLKGIDTILSTGTDEHGIKMMKAAQAASIRDPKMLCDLNAEVFKEMMKKASISYDTFIRTTEGLLYGEIRTTCKSGKSFLEQIKC